MDASRTIPRRAEDQRVHDLLTGYVEDVVWLESRISDLEHERDIYCELLKLALTRCHYLNRLVREQQDRLYPRNDDQWSDIYTDDLTEAWIAHQQARAQQSAA